MLGLLGTLLVLFQDPSPGALAQAEQALRSGRHEAAREQLAPLAAAGEARASTLLGVLYLEGLGGERDLAQALQQFRRAQSADPTAKYHLGRMVHDGLGIQADPGEGLRLLTDAAKAGELPARDELARLYRMYVDKSDRTRDKRDVELAWYSLYGAAEGGYAPAQVKAAHVFLQGWFHDLNCDRDNVEAARLLSRAMASDETAAEARRELEKLAENQSFLETWLAKGMLTRPFAEVRRDHARIRDLLLHAQQDGDVQAMIELGRLYLMQGLPTYDRDAGERLLEQAFAQRWFEAGMLLGEHLRRRGTEEDDVALRVRGVQLLLDAGEDEYATGAAQAARRELEQEAGPDYCYVRGCQLLDGVGATKDPKAARSWLERATLAGQPLALARLYEAMCAAGEEQAALALVNRLAERDQSEAMRYLAQAARLGSEQAWKKVVEELEHDYPPAMHWYATAILEQRRNGKLASEDEVQRANSSILKAARRGFEPAKRYVLENVETAPPALRFEFARLCLLGLHRQQLASMRVLLDGALMRHGPSCFVLADACMTGLRENGVELVAKSELDALFWLREADGEGVADQELRSALVEMRDNLESAGYLLPGDEDPLPSFFNAEKARRLSEDHKRLLRSVYRRQGKGTAAATADRLYAKEYAHVPAKKVETPPHFDPTGDAMRTLARLHQLPGGTRWLACFWLERAEQHSPSPAGARALADLRAQLTDADQQELAARTAVWQRLPMRTIRSK
ncbi:MAG: sel1 repeat family protein [Planctomycetes bacterium]|nr:sel1 repeat family protein [Planctomycetota bacterium]